MAAPRLALPSWCTSDTKVVASQLGASEEREPVRHHLPAVCHPCGAVPDPCRARRHWRGLWPHLPCTLKPRLIPTPNFCAPTPCCCASCAVARASCERSHRQLRTEEGKSRRSLRRKSTQNGAGSNFALRSEGLLVKAVLPTASSLLVQAPSTKAKERGRVVVPARRRFLLSVAIRVFIVTASLWASLEHFCPRWPRILHFPEFFLQFS